MVNSLTNIGHDVTVFTPYHKLRGYNHINLIEVPINNNLRFTALQFWLSIPKYISNDSFSDFDILHFNGISYGFIKKRLLDIPQVITIHHTVKDSLENSNDNFLRKFFNISGEEGFFMQFIEKRCVKSVNQIISDSNFTKNSLINYYNVNEDKIGVVNPGIASKETIPDSNKSKFESILGIQGPFILFVGRIDDKRKGLDILLKALYLVLKKINVYLIIVGSGEKKNAINLSKKLGILKNIVFMGFVDESDLQLCYSFCDLYVTASRMEGFGLTLLEAMSFGKPIVGTNVGSIPEIIQNGENGILVESEDYHALAEGILKILIDFNLNKKISDNNKMHVNNFSWQKTAENTVKIYEKLIR